MFKYNKICLSLLAVALFIVTLLLPLDKSYALPSFARQTGLNCYNCHTIWPELTPMGRAFKLTGYVQSTSDRPYEPFPPLSVGGVISYTGGDQAGGLTNGISPFDNADHKYTDKTNALQEFNAFYGGRIYGDFGAFLQGTFDGVAKKLFWIWQIFVTLKAMPRCLVNHSCLELQSITGLQYRMCGTVHRYGAFLTQAHPWHQPLQPPQS